MSKLMRIMKSELPHLKNLFKRNWPLHASSYVLVDHFADRFENHPKWEEKVKFYTLNDSWMDTGTFAMVNESDQNIFFNTLEDSPYATLKQTLYSLNMEQEQAFIAFRDIFRPLVHDVIRVQHLEKTFDSGVRLLHGPREGVRKLKEKFGIKLPNDFHFGSLTLDHVEKVNSFWMQQDEKSLDYLTTVIRLNFSTGLFNSKTGELVAWCLTLETGALGTLQIDEKYAGKKMGEATYIEQMIKCNSLDKEVVGYILHQNSFSHGMSMKLGGKWIDNNSFIGVKKKVMMKVVPMYRRVQNA